MTANASLFSQMKPTFPDGGYKSFPKMGSVKFFCTFIRRHIDKSDNTMYTYYKVHSDKIRFVEWHTLRNKNLQSGVFSHLIFLFFCHIYKIKSFCRRILDGICCSTRIFRKIANTNVII